VLGSRTWCCYGSVCLAGLPNRVHSMRSRASCGFFVWLDEPAACIKCLTRGDCWLSSPVRMRRLPPNPGRRLDPRRDATAPRSRLP